MIVTYTSEFAVTSLDDTVAKATENWRAFIGNPEADLHWSAVALVHQDTTGETIAQVTIKVNDTGAPGSA